MDEQQDLHTVLGYLGEFGRYQGLQFFLHILSALTAGLHMLSLTTVAAVPDHRCFVPEVDVNVTGAVYNASGLEDWIPRAADGSWDRCSVYKEAGGNESFKCDAWVYDHTYYGDTRVTEWDLVCDKRWMKAVAQSMYMLGVFFGAVFLGGLADKIGRKPVFCWSAVLQLFLGVTVAFVPEYYTFLVVRFLYGIFGSAGSYITGFVLTMETVGPSYRSVCGIAFQAVFAGGFMLVAAWGAVIKTRFWLQVIYGLHGLILIGHWWLMDESPTWLWTQGRIKEAVSIVQKGLKMNGSYIKLDPATYEANNATKKLRKEEETGSAGLADLLKTKNLRNKTMNVCLNWFANSLVYYGLSLNSGQFAGNPFLILFLMGLVEMPSYVLTVILMDRMGRRGITSICMIAGGVCCILAAYMLVGSTEATVIAMFGKFFIASSFAVIYNYSAELFPTVVRNSAMGLGSMFARMSGISVPLITLLDSFEPKLPAVIFAIISIISGFLTLFLPETLGQPMPQTLEDGETFGVGDSAFTSCMGKKAKERGSYQQPMETVKTEDT